MNLKDDPKSPPTDTEQVLSLDQALTSPDLEGLKTALEKTIVELKARREEDPENEDLTEELIRCQNELLHIEHESHPGPGWKSVCMVNEKQGNPWSSFKDYEREFGIGNVKKVSKAFGYTGRVLPRASTIFIRES